MAKGAGTGPTRTNAGTIGSHALDWRAVAAGALAQGVVVFVLFVVADTIEVLAASVVVSGAVAGLLSRNYRDEAVDGGVAAALGGAVSVVAVIAGIFFTLRASSLGLRLDVTVVLGLYGLFVAGMGGILSGFLGAIVAHVVARYHERWRLRQEYV